MKAFRHDFSIASLALFAFITLTFSGCAAWKTQQGPPGEIVAAKSPKYIRLTDREGRRMELSYPRVEADSIVGYLGISPHPRVAVGLSDIVKTEVLRIDAARTVLLVTGIGVTLLLIAAASMDTPMGGGGPPPSGGGDGPGYEASCPLLYSWDGAAWQLDSGTFGGAIQRPLAREDVDNLEHAMARGGRLQLRLTDEMDETEYVDAVAVMAVDHDPGISVAPDASGKLLAYAGERPPSRAEDLDGGDVLAQVTARDGWSCESRLRPRDPDLPEQLRDGLDLEFPRPAGAEACLLVDGQDTPWTAYLLGEYVRAHGRDEAAWQRNAEAHPAAARAAMQRIHQAGALQVEVWTKSGWERTGALTPPGPEVVKRQALRLDLSRCAGSTVRLRLTSLPSFWLIDRVSLGTLAHGAIEAHELMLVAARDSAGTDIRELLGSRDDRYYEMERGAAARLTFAVPETSPGRARSYVARTSGWYRIHCDPTREPDLAFLRRVEREPGGIARLAVGRANAALLHMGMALR